MGETDQIREHERDRARCGDHYPIIFQQRHELEEREEHARRDDRGDERGDTARRGLVDVEAPAIGRKGFEFEQQTAKQHHQSRKGDRPCDSLAGGNQIVDIENSGGRVEQHGAEQEECRSHDGGHQELERRRERLGFRAETEQSVGRDRHDLEEDEKVEEIASRDHADHAHHKDEIEQHDGIFPAQKVDRAEQRRHRGARRDESLAKSHAEIDGVRRQGTPSQNLDRLAAIIEMDGANGRDERHRGERGQERGCYPALAETIEQRDQEARAQPDDKDVERVKEAAYHFESAKASMDSVFFAS